MRTTIKMIAERAGVSIGTVDRVLHDRPYVKAEVRERVLRVMEELDYHPNRMASALATSGTPRKLALVQPEWEEGFVRDEMDAGTARFLEEYRDYNVSLDIRNYPSGDEAECLRLLNEAVENGAQAVALCASGTEEIRRALERLSERGVPGATFNSDVPGGRRICYVGEDGHRAGRVAGEIASCFLSRGDAFLVIYADPKYTAHKARVDGFLERLGEIGDMDLNLQAKILQVLQEGIIYPVGSVLPEKIDVRVIAATHRDYRKTAETVESALAAHPNLRMVYMANPSVPACAEVLRSRGLAEKVHILSHDCGPEIQELLKSGEVDFTIGQDLAYQPYQALSVLFEALMGQRPDRDTYVTACPILNSESI